MMESGEYLPQGMPSASVMPEITIEEVSRKIAWLEQKITSENDPEKMKQLWEEKKQLRDKKKQLRDKEYIMMQLQLLAAPPPPPTPPTPPTPPPTPPSLADLYVDRECAKLDDVIASMKFRVTALFGPKGAGKSRTLLEAYHKVASSGEGAYYTDLAMDRDSRYERCSVISGILYFVDNAQLLRKNGFPNLLGLLSVGKVCLAFSSTAIDGGSYNNCRLTILNIYYMKPFTPAEITLYLSKNFPSSSYSHETTLPIIVQRLLCKFDTYRNIVLKEIQHVLDKVKSAIVNGEGEAGIFTYLYILCLHGNCTNFVSNLLQDRGLVYINGTEVCLVYERKYLIQCLCSYAMSLHDFFIKYDVGGAKELLFSHMCSTSRITVVCRGNKCLTIKGKTTEKPCSIDLLCSEYLVQKNVGDDVAADDNKCYLIKLALNHTAIDFLILDCSGGTAASKALYLIQVSSTRYQDRPANRKFDAIFEKTSTLGGMSVYDYYFNKFKIRNYNAFYIYSSPEIAPASNAAQMKHIYFHHLTTIPSNF